MKRKLTMLESVKFNIFIDKMGITHKEIYRTILEDFLSGSLSIEEFVASYH